ncbi:MAG: DUF3536 domain-containing protein [Desulfatiglans sp.]|jgi:alpha-amylase/alpha-mannosidase (GH57 family)|nr:DUF3536 domain-containing protein [Thermodesulfobacteriota bacterium]MEE4352269.1 DUF3536 domain-containing protein [Desulfatiglans sp.]
MSNNYLCVHGHFYQPPRENPWLDFIEMQPSAAPYHDWNERITRECYGPNVRARIHDQQGHIVKAINNYLSMSYDFGPTLLSWMEMTHPWIYQQILNAHHASRKRFEGHGNAMAQVYNHMIMPLASKRDKITQIRWGLADFKYRFGTEAEGMWLAETAVDRETLTLMALEGVKFTVLSPTQASSVRPLAGRAKDRSWKDVGGGRIDTTQPYRVQLDRSGKLYMDVFFYDAALSRGVAYENILSSGEALLSRIRHALKEGKEERPRLINIATDGESYGHHFKFGDLALSWLFDHLEISKDINVTNYALFLERFPPQNEVKLFENSSWSCAHGIERWRSDCGCRIHHQEGWNQSWRAPLREGLNWLRDELESIYLKQCGRLLKDPWEARDGYVSLLLNPDARHKEIFLKRHARRALTGDEKIEVLQLIESQRMSMYMFTSCGWFFDEISGLEATQILKYAARAIDLVKPWAPKDLEKGLLRFLSLAASNDPIYKTGDAVYKKLVIPSKTGPSAMTANYALLDMEMESKGRPPILSESVRIARKQDLRLDNTHVSLGETLIEESTGRKHRRFYTAVRRGRTELWCMAGEPVEGVEVDMEEVASQLRDWSIEGSLETIEALFAPHMTRSQRFDFDDLLPDTRKWLFHYWTEELKDRMRSRVHDIYGELIEIISFMEEKDEPTSGASSTIFCLVLYEEFMKLMDGGRVKGSAHRDILRRSALTQSEVVKKTLDSPVIRQKAQQYLRSETERVVVDYDGDRIKDIIQFLDVLRDLNIEADLWECQNIFYDMYGDLGVKTSLSPDQVLHYKTLGTRLGFALEES